MNEQQALEFIHSIERFGSRPGLERIGMLLERMGNPQKRLSFVHVAGTNGKGSVCTMLSHILVRGGYRTGLYISPFVLDFRERIQVDNEMISPRELAACTEVVKAHWDAMDAMGEPPTEFEVVVAVAMEYFVRRGCDLVVLEVGMGGRFDATNIIDRPLCSVITRIGIDHTQYLGDTIPQIALEKCGIIKEGGVTVTCPGQEAEAMEVIREQCRLRNNRLLQGDLTEVEVLTAGIGGSGIRYQGREYRIPLAGPHQISNALTVLEAVKALNITGLKLADDAAREGIASTRFPSRLEVLGRSPLILLDGAHNLDGMKALRNSLSLLEGKDIHVILGMVSDKDIDGVLEQILPCCRSMIAVRPEVPRGLPAETLAEKARSWCDDVTVAADSASALEAGLARCGTEDVLLICGSLYLAATIRPLALQQARQSSGPTAQPQETVE